MDEIGRLQNAGDNAEAAFHDKAARWDLTVVIDACNPHNPKIERAEYAAVLGFGQGAEQRSNARLLLQSYSFDFLVRVDGQAEGYAFVEVKNSTSRNWIELTGPSFRLVESLAVFSCAPVRGFTLFVRHDHLEWAFNVLSKQDDDWSAEWAKTISPLTAPLVTQFVDQSLAEIRTGDGLPRSLNRPASKAGQCVRSDELWVYFQKRQPDALPPPRNVG